MKSLSLFLLVCLCSSCVNSKKDPNDAAPENNNALTTLTVSKKIATFGTVPGDTLLTARFTLKNTGENKLVISELTADCTCTEHYISKEVIAPSDSAYLTLKVSTKNKFGDFKVYTTFKANTQTNLYILSVQGSIKNDKI